MKEKTENKMVLVTTERRGVFVGKLDAYDAASRVAILTDARMAIRWGTTNGLFQLADSGPTPNSKISAKVDKIRLELCECIIDISDKAEAAWNALA